MKVAGEDAKEGGLKENCKDIQGKKIVKQDINEEKANK